MLCVYDQLYTAKCKEWQAHSNAGVNPLNHFSKIALIDSDNRTKQSK